MSVLAAKLLAPPARANLPLFFRVVLAENTSPVLALSCQPWASPVSKSHLLRPQDPSGHCRNPVLHVYPQVPFVQLVGVAFALVEHAWQLVPHDAIVVVSRQTPSGQLNFPFAQVPLHERLESMQALLQICWLAPQDPEHCPAAHLAVPPLGAAQTWPQVPQFCTSVVVSVPPTQLENPDQLPLLHVRVWVPVQPQVWLVGPLQEQVPQWQSLPQVWEPPAVPQAWVAPGAHAPSPVHADHTDHIPVLPSQVCVCIPQLPHDWLAGPAHF